MADDQHSPEIVAGDPFCSPSAFLRLVADQMERIGERVESRYLLAQRRFTTELTLSDFVSHFPGYMPSRSDFNQYENPTEAHKIALNHEGKTVSEDLHPIGYALLHALANRFSNLSEPPNTRNPGILITELYQDISSLFGFEPSGGEQKIVDGVIKFFVNRGILTEIEDKRYGLGSMDGFSVKIPAALASNFQMQ